MKGYMYILECSDGSYYVGSTNNLELRLAQHQAGEGANHTKKRLPVTLVYYEEYQKVQQAFYREKQVQGWRREKKEALIKGDVDSLPMLAKAYNVAFDKLRQQQNDKLRQQQNDKLRQQQNDKLRQQQNDKLRQPGGG